MTIAYMSDLPVHNADPAADDYGLPVRPIGGNGASALAGGIPSTARLLSAAADTNSTLVKASAGRVYMIHGYNAALAVRYLKLYNKATAPTVGTDTPRATIALPPQSTFFLDFPVGMYFASGIGFGMVTAVADNSTAALTAADVLGLNIHYA